MTTRKKQAGSNRVPRDLAEIRSRIDETDRKLLRLLDQRIEYAVRAARFKSAAADHVREAQVLGNVRDAAYGLLAPEFVTSLYRAIIDEGKRLQVRRPRLAAFQGERGAWSEMACQMWDADLVAIPCRTFAEVFDAVARGTCDRGVVPVENSLEGAVIEVSDLLVGSDLSIIGEVLLPVRQCLLALPGTGLRDIRAVYSHPQALGQCRGYLSRNGLDARPFYDTAGAARWLMFEGVRTAGVIASPLAATLYGLELVADSIADDAGNETRFVILAREAQAGPADKGSLVIVTEHRSGALVQALAAFADQGINLSRIESRPYRKKRGTYAFLIDFAGGPDEPAVVQALARLRAQSVSIKELGFYRTAVSGR